MKENMKVTGWTYWSNKDYIEISDYNAYLDAREVVAKEIRNKGYYITGPDHQQYDFGCPIINNKYKLTCSFRGWGEIMHIAYPEELKSYIDYAWFAVNDKIVLPKEEDIENGK